MGTCLDLPTIEMYSPLHLLWGSRFAGLHAFVRAKRGPSGRAPLIDRTAAKAESHKDMRSKWFVEFLLPYIQICGLNAVKEVT